MKPSYPPKNGKRALVTGITGQDGSYLAELLLAKGYEVYGMVRRSSSFNTGRLDHIYQDPHEADVRLRLVYGDLADGSSLDQLVKTIRPDEIYNLGAQSHVRVSFDIPEYTSEITGPGLHSVARSDSRDGAEVPFLSGVVVGDVRQGVSRRRKRSGRRSIRAARMRVRRCLRLMRRGIIASRTACSR